MFQIVVLFVVSSSASTEAAAVEAKPPPLDDRRFSVGFAPGQMSPTLDVDLVKANIFLSGGLLLPLVSDGRMASFSIGGGPLWLVTEKACFKLGFFAHAAAGFYGQEKVATTPPYSSLGIDYAAVGAFGVGMHFSYTHPSGFTLVGRVPVFGYAVGAPNGTASAGVAYYYLFAYTGVPTVTLGYRF